jgi:hypothetical protein
MADDLIPHTHAERSRSQTPPVGSATAYFVDLARRAHGDDFVASWLLPSLTVKMSDGQMAFQNCEFTHNRIFTTSVGVDRLNRACNHLAEKANVVILECPALRAKFSAWARKYRKGTK